MTIKNKYQLTRHLHYNPHTGVFTRIQQPVNSPLRIGEISNNTLLERGKIQILKTYYRAGRLAYLYMTGKLPEGTVEHLNGDASDFRWDNLWLVTPSYEGDGKITWIPGRQRYQAYIKKKYVGSFKIREEAEAAIDAAHLLPEGATGSTGK